MNLLRQTLFVLSICTATAYAQPEPEPEFKIEPTSENMAEMTFAGVATYAGPGSSRFPELWSQGFHDAMGDTSQGRGARMGLETEKYAYGLELFPPSFDQQSRFTYVAAFSVLDSRKVPLHLVQRTLPAARYAAFKVPGGLAGLGEAYRFINFQWLPRSGYDRSYPFDMERYDLVAPAANGEKPVLEELVPVTPHKDAP